MKNGKRLFCLLLILALVFSLTACRKTNEAKGDDPSQESQGEQQQDEATILVQGKLDSLYLGQYNEEYLKLRGISEEEAAAEREDNLSVNVEYFARTLYINGLTDEVRSELTELYQELFSKLSYRVTDSSQIDENNYAVTVEVAPADIVQQIQEATANWAPATADTDAEWARTVLDTFREKLETLGYLEAQNLAVQVTKGEDGSWTVSDDNIYTIDEYIVYFAA